ncbi:hypothetical protein GGR57DRAFT_473077 [Xylariaceae sp. FL1272]|nr:hypothetical protein GGR57DRAFT_473077 [Xylariaceae sp. FL1272]
MWFRRLTLPVFSIWSGNWASRHGPQQIEPSLGRVFPYPITGERFGCAVRSVVYAMPVPQYHSMKKKMTKMAEH